MALNFFNDSGDENDAYKNIVKDAKEYGELYLQLFKLNTVDILSKFLSYLIVIIAGVMLLVTVLIFLAMILVLLMKDATGSTIYSLLIMSGIFLLLFVLLLVFRKKLMLNPIIKKLSSIIFNTGMKKQYKEQIEKNYGEAAKSANKGVIDAEIIKEEVHD